MKEYKPNPLDTRDIHLDENLIALIEKIATNTHDVWAQQRIQDGWIYGSQRDDEKKTHPSLIPYSELSDSEKNYDRITAREVIKVIILIGYSIIKK
jgi:hypothetical protein